MLESSEGLFSPLVFVVVNADYWLGPPLGLAAGARALSMWLWFPQHQSLNVVQAQGSKRDCPSQGEEGALLL